MEQYQIDDMMTKLQTYLERSGIDTSKFFTCINPSHIDRHPSMRYFDDHKVYCFGCHASYNLIDVISIMEKLDKKEAFKKAIDYFSNQNLQKIPKKIEKNDKKSKKNDNFPKNYEKAYNFWHKNFNENNSAKEYLRSRGISEETAKKFKLGFNTFDFKKFKLDAIVIPINENCFTARNINPDDEFRYYKPKNCHADIFNKAALTNEEPICVITEGEFDSMSYDTIGVNSIALCSASNIGKFIDCEKSPNKSFIISLDNDNAGKVAETALIDYFKANNINYRVFNNCGYKDANEALTSDKKTFENKIKKLIEEIEKNSRTKKRNRDFEM